MTLPALPDKGSTDWYDHYEAVDAAIRAGTVVDPVAAVGAVLVPSGYATVANGAPDTITIGTSVELDNALESRPVSGDVDTAIATATDRMVHDVEYDGTQWPVRPDTSGTNQRVYWWGPLTATLARTGTSAGGTRAAAPHDRIFLS